MATTTNALGARLLVRFAADPPSATREQLDAAHTRGWISDEDYTTATAPVT